MKRHLVLTKDQSPTFYVPELDEHYHSVHGALAESNHVFINAGLKPAHQRNSEVKVLEMGLGTGLNAWLSLKYGYQNSISIHYHGLEKYPLSIPEAESISFDKDESDFIKIHHSAWQKEIDITPGFRLYKDQVDLLSFTPRGEYDLIYFDAFAPSAQPELWSEEIFRKLHSCMKTDGILVTYCVKGQVRRNMKAAGFRVEKIPGPPGKREMARAFKAK